MASRPGLRFDPAVFVETGVDPETWSPMRKPNGINWIIVCAAVGAAVWIGHASMGSWPLAVTVAIVLTVMALGGTALFGFRRAAYPGFNQPIGFRPEQPSDAPAEPGGLL
jgi:hypothetical protein